MYSLSWFYFEMEAYQRKYEAFEILNKVIENFETIGVLVAFNIK
jgi:hypothetical protein